MRDRVQKKRALALERARKEEMVLRLHEDRLIRQEVNGRSHAQFFTSFFPSSPTLFLRVGCSVHAVGWWWLWWVVVV